MTHRRRVALVLVLIAFAAAAQLASARSSSIARFGDAHESVHTPLTQHEDSAVVPVSRLVRSTSRALGELPSVTLAGVLAFVALLALWFPASVRRRERLASAVLTYRRRGPPALPPVI